MRKFSYTLGLALAAMFAYGVIAAGSASALTLWDQCTKTAALLEFKNSDCTEKASPFEWGWEEIKTKLETDSLLATLTLSSAFAGGTISVACEGFVDGFVGPGAEDEVTKLLNDTELEVTLTTPVKCKVTKDASFVCGGVGTEAEAAPENLPWKTELVATGDLLGPHAGGGNPGWWVLCLSGIKPETICTRADSILKVENLEAELEVDLTFKPAEEAECGGGLKGSVEGTVSVLLTNGNALRAM